MEPTYAFVAAAEWPDDIKGMNWKSFNPLHFLNIPIIEPDFTGVIDTSVTNATYAIVRKRNHYIGKMQRDPQGKGRCS